MEMEWLKSNNVQFEEILVDENPDQAEKMIEISGQMGVPFTVIDKEDGARVTILGFDQPKLSEALGLSSE